MGREINLQEALWRITRVGAVNEVSIEHTSTLVDVCALAQRRIGELEAALRTVTPWARAHGQCGTLPTEHVVYEEYRRAMDQAVRTLQKT